MCQKSPYGLRDIYSLHPERETVQLKKEANLNMFQPRGSKTNSILTIRIPEESQLPSNQVEADSIPALQPSGSGDHD